MYIPNRFAALPHTSTIMADAARKWCTAKSKSRTQAAQEVAKSSHPALHLLLMSLPISLYLTLEQNLLKLYWDDKSLVRSHRQPQ